jgi:catechol 2,3-dioxygenase-like lactoylglutathione lyase family enzyme
MPIRNVSHVAVGVRQMDRALPFYRDVIGLEVRFDDTEEFGGVDGRPSVKRRGVYLRWKDDPQAPFIVLDEQLSREPSGTPKQLFETGIHHFGFWVDNIDQIADRARAAGIEFVHGPSDADTLTYGEPPGGTIRTMLVRDPEGNVVQFDQRLQA